MAIEVDFGGDRIATVSRRVWTCPRSEAIESCLNTWTEFEQVGTQHGDADIWLARNAAAKFGGDVITKIVPPVFPTVTADGHPICY